MVRKREKDLVLKNIQSIRHSCKTLLRKRMEVLTVHSFTCGVHIYIHRKKLQAMLFRTKLSAMAFYFSAGASTL